MILLTLETEHYQFQALGENDHIARETLKHATDYHAEQVGIASNWVDHYDVQSLEIFPGECFRDGQLLYRRP